MFMGLISEEMKRGQFYFKKAVAQYTAPLWGRGL